MKRFESGRQLRAPSSLGMLVRPMLCTAMLCGCAQNEAQVEPAHESNPAEINQRYTDPQLDVIPFVERWENENRDVFHNRREIVGALRLTGGETVADIGAGTGAFTEPIARKVGFYGFVYAVDIAQPFLNYIQSRARAANLVQVRTVLGTQDSVQLATRSIDVAFCCDTYHHFENPPAILASIHRALREGGEFVVLEYDRVEGVSREWILNHIRKTKAQTIAEIEQAGFQLNEEIDMPALPEHYMLRFVKKHR